MSYKDLLKISSLVKRAIQEQRPVVSLESTIISHGMPYPNNKKCAIEVEDILRERGVEPATIAIMHGRIHIGLTHDEIQQLAQGGEKARKVSRRDIPYVLAQKGLGSTTVAGTMICSALAGIDLFVTGGLGGVHRGYEETMDVSADLRELGRTPVNVVSAGVKNILDIPRTLEYLQTQGVPVITYGSKYFPAFFAPSSGLLSPISYDNIEDIAEMLLMRKRLNLQNGVLVTVPNQDIADAQLIQKAIQTALKQAEEQKITGAATTPFLLKRVHTITAGASVRANISLVKHNARIGAYLALAYNRKEHPHRQTFIDRASNEPRMIVIGGCALDYQITINGKFTLYQSTKGNWRTSFGGVGRNIAEVAGRLGTPTTFITALGQDQHSIQLKKNIVSHNIQLCVVESDKESKGPLYLSVLDDNKDSIIAISNMDINQNLTFDKIKAHLQRTKNARDIVVVDANVQADNQNLRNLLSYLNQEGYFVLYECKGKKTINASIDKNYQLMSVIKMNELEADLLLDTLAKQGHDVGKNTSERSVQWFANNIGSCSKNTKLTDICTIITRGSNGFTTITRDAKYSHYSINKSTNIIKATGAGDTFTGTLCSLLLKQYSISTALTYSSVASKMTVESQGKDSVICDQLTLNTLKEAVGRSDYAV